MANKIQWRRDLAANWTSVNPVLSNGMPGYETDTCRLKIGDGVTAWNALPYKFEETITTLVESPAGTFTYTSEDNTQTVFSISGGGGGESNTAANLGSGVGVFKLKSGIELQFKSINAGSNKVTITDDTGNDEIDIDIVPANILTSELNNDADFIPDAPSDGQQYARQNNVWSIVTGGGGPTDHGGLTGLGDDDHLQYLTEARHDALPFDNPHNVNATDVGLGNVDNTSDVDKPVSTAQASADSAVQAFSIQRSNHTGTQTASTISDFANQVTVDETTTSLSLTDSVLTYNDEDGVATNLQLNVFGTQAEDFIDTSNTNITTATPFAVRTFTTQSNPTGRYRIAMNVQFEPNSTAGNYLFQLRINGTQIGLEMEEEGKDVGSDQRNLRPLIGYYDHIGPATFNIELWAARESNTLVLHGVSAEVWRVS